MTTYKGLFGAAAVVVPTPHHCLERLISLKTSTNSKLDVT